MDEATLRVLIEGVRSGEVSPADAVASLRRLPFVDLGFARIDHHRALRQGMPEAVYGPGKTGEQCAAIVEELLAHGNGPVLLTRASPQQVEITTARNPCAERIPTVDESSLLVWRAAPVVSAARVLVISAGTADLPVAAEAEGTLRAYGWAVEQLRDCGVAGIHRLLNHVDEIATADAVVVVAGMEGALPSVIGGLTGAPVVAVPTSVGYGAAFAGVTALLAMLSACAPGIVVVGIDNGYGAACAIARLLGGVSSADTRHNKAAHARGSITTGPPIAPEPRPTERAALCE